MLLPSVLIRLGSVLLPIALLRVALHILVTPLGMQAISVKANDLYPWQRGELKQGNEGNMHANMLTIQNDIYLVPYIKCVVHNIFLLIFFIL